MSNLDAINAVLISPLISILKSKTSSLLEKRDLMLKCYNEGLYHITSEENVKKILESGYLKQVVIFLLMVQRRYFCLLEFHLLKKRVQM